MHIIIERSRDPHLFIKREEQPIVAAYVAKRERERKIIRTYARLRNAREPTARAYR